jgi:NAD(P)H-flavin reductase
MAELVGDAMGYRSEGYLEYVKNVLEDYGIDPDLIISAGPHIMAGLVIEGAQEKLRKERFEVMKKEGLSLTFESYKDRWLSWMDANDETKKRP